MIKDLEVLKCFNCGQLYRIDEYSRTRIITCSGCGMEIVPLIAGKICERDTKGFCIVLGFFTIAALLGAIGGIMMVHGWNFWLTFAIIGGIIFFVGKIFMGKYKITEIGEYLSVEVVQEYPARKCVSNFDQLVVNAIQELPQSLKDRLSTVSIVVENKPNSNVLGKLKLMPNTALLGLFQGVPLNKRSVWQSGTMPERITIFQENIEAVSHSDEEIKKRIKNVVRHEVAHFVGFTEGEIKKLGY